MRALLLFLTLSNYCFSMTTGTLILSGTVQNSNQLSVSPNGTANVTLNITRGENGKIIAEITEISNNMGGYTVSISSLNGGILKNDGIVGPSYTISYNGGPAITPTTNPIVVRTVSSLVSKTETKVAITITFVGMPNVLSGIFSDVLTFELTVN